MGFHEAAGHSTELCGVQQQPGAPTLPVSEGQSDLGGHEHPF